MYCSRDTAARWQRSHSLCAAGVAADAPGDDTEIETGAGAGGGAGAPLPPLAAPLLSARWRASARADAVARAAMHDTSGATAIRTIADTPAA